MESLLAFVHEWGYIAVFLGAIVEGETIILFSSALAALGHLNIYKIMLITFCTTVVVDQGLYMIGKRYSSAIFKRFPKLRPKADRAFKLLHKYDTWFILTFRFIYGIRVISPIVIGAANVEAKRFGPLNILSAVIWTSASCYAGYMMGDLVEILLNNIKVVKQYVAIVLAVVVGIVISIYAWKFFKKSREV